MQANYTPFIDRMIGKYEGGYCWDRNDPGGPTNFGITCYDLAEFRGQHMDSMQAWSVLVKAMTLSEAEAIYRTKYAIGIRFDDLPSGIDCCMMDFAVNSGIGRAIQFARRILDVPGGNVIDLDLFDKFEQADPHEFIDRLCDERLAFMQGLKNWPTFKNGWKARVTDLHGYCYRVAGGYPAPHPAPPPIQPHPKAIAPPTVWERLSNFFRGS